MNFFSKQKKRGNKLFEVPGPLARRGKGGYQLRKKVCCRAFF